MKIFSAILLTVAIAVPVTWFVTTRTHSPAPANVSQAAPGGRKVLYYQSAMHPWIKSDKPGRCTICGMELTPVYEGESGFDLANDVVPLSQTTIQVLNVQTAEAQIRPLHKTLKVAGMIDDNATRHRVLSAYIPGRIQKLYVNYPGAEVKEGQPLAEFYSPMLLQAEREYRSLTGDLRAATALRLLQMGLTSGQIETLTNKPADQLTSQILAPVGGTVVEQYVYEGQYVQEGEKLFEIADFSTMWFQFRAYEQDLPWIKTGLQVDVTTPSHPGWIFTGRISFIEPNFDPVTRSTNVRVELDNPPVESGHRMLHRLYADGVVHLEAPEVLTVPRTAVIETGQQAVAYVNEEGKAYSRRVLKLGRRGDALIEVQSGLSAGEKVVTHGNLLIDGQAEMNRDFAEVGGRTAKPPMRLPALTETERRTIQEFLNLIDSLVEVLAADNLDGFNARAPKIAETTSALNSAFPENSPWHPLIHPFSLVEQLSVVRDLSEARRQFHPLSTGASVLVQTLKRTDAQFGSVKVFRCPMTKNVFEGAPRTAEWIQLRGPIQNPWMGPKMLDCGTEVKP